MDINQEDLNRMVGKRLRVARLAQNLTQAELAERSGVSRPSIAVIELGRQSSPLHVIYRLCLGLGSELSTLLPEVQEVVNTFEENELGNETAKTNQIVGELLAMLDEAGVDNGRSS
jgi:transcriptional regulator with XRE-family HTH domain